MMKVKMKLDVKVDVKVEVKVEVKVKVNRRVSVSTVRQCNARHPLTSGDACAFSYCCFLFIVAVTRTITS
jgi:hypothetical protein